MKTAVSCSGFRWSCLWLFCLTVVLLAGCGSDQGDDKAGSGNGNSPHGPPAGVAGDDDKPIPQSRIPTRDNPAESSESTGQKPGPWALAKEFKWKQGQPKVKMMHRDEGFAYLTGVRGALPVGSEVTILPDSEGNWRLSGTDHQRLSGSAVACPWFVDAEWPAEMKVWHINEPGFPQLIHQRDGFCVLLKVGGRLVGHSDEFRLHVDDNGYWRLRAASKSAGTRVRVAIIKTNQPGTFRGEVGEHTWQAGEEPVRLIHKNDGIAFLSGLTGTFFGASDYARVTLHDDGYWYLEGQSANKGDIIARAMTIRLSGTQTKPPQIAANDTASSTGRWTGAKQYQWKHGQQAVKMNHRDDGIALLTGVQGKLIPTSEVGVVQNPQGDWLLEGTPTPSELSGTAVAVPFFAEVERPHRFESWTIGQGAAKLKKLEKIIRSEDGFCVYQMIGGQFRGFGEQYRLLIKDGYWRFNARSQAGRTRTRILVVRMKQPGSFNGVVHEYHWSADNNRAPIRMIHGNDGFAFLTGIGGTFVGNQDYARVTRHDDGYWYLEGGSSAGDVKAWAVSIQLSKADTKPPVVATNDPPTPQQATIHGSWEIVEATNGGDKDEDLVGDVYVFSDDGKQFKIHIDGSKVNTLSFECNIDQENNRVDYSLASLKFLGLYKLEGDKLTLCFDQDERPADFTSTADNDNRLLVLKRIAGSGGNSSTTTASTSPQPASKAPQAIAALKKLGFEFYDENHTVEIGYPESEKLKDDDFAHFRDLPEVTELTMYNTPLTDKGLAHLVTLKDLEKLSLDRSQITDEGLKLIGQMTSLEEFQLGIHDAPTVTGAGLMYLKPLTGMRKLEVSAAKVGPGGLAFLSDMHDLEEFTYASNNRGIDESDLKTLGSLTKLEWLALSGEKAVNTATIGHLSNLKSLQYLYLNDTSISDRALLTLKEFSELSVLELRGTRVGDAGMRTLAGMTSLASLDLSETRVTGRGLALLKNLRVNSLTLSGRGVNDRHLAGLTEWKELRTLGLSGEYDLDRRRPIPNRITINGIKILSEMEQLDVLKLSNNPQITDAAVPYLSKLKNLVALELSNTSITPAGGRTIAGAVEGLDLDELGIADK